MLKTSTDETGRRRKWTVATCVALVLAAVGDAGPEIIESRSLVAGYDGPGPLIYLAIAILIVTARWRFVPLLAVVLSALFLVGGLANADFAQRLTNPPGIAFVAGWVQMLSFAAAIVCGTAAVGRRATTSRSGPPALIRRPTAGEDQPEGRCRAFDR